MELISETFRKMCLYSQFLSNSSVRDIEVVWLILFLLWKL